MQVLIAPAPFKGSLSARMAAEAMAVAVRSVSPGARIDVRPLSDGGGGFIDALVAKGSWRIDKVLVTGPFGARVQSPVARRDSDDLVAIESAAICGWSLVASDALDPLRGTTRGVGEALAHGLKANEAAPARAIVVGLGDTVTVDGGAGMATALGWRFLDDRGRSLGPGGGSLRRVARIEPPQGGFTFEPEVIAACDVDNPLVGPDGAARVFAPQKGASPHEVEVLEEGLENLMERVRADLGRDIGQIPGGGAAGGLGAGLAAFVGASLRPGFEVVSESTDLAAALQACDLVLTGEGRLDDQSLRGKATMSVAGMARAVGKPCAVVAGEVVLDTGTLEDRGVEAAISLRDVHRDPLADPQAAVREATEMLLRRRRD